MTTSPQINTGEGAPSASAFVSPQPTTTTNTTVRAPKKTKAKKTTGNSRIPPGSFWLFIPIALIHIANLYWWPGNTTLAAGTLIIMLAIWARLLLTKPVWFLAVDLVILFVNADAWPRSSALSALLLAMPIFVGVVYFATRRDYSDRPIPKTGLPRKIYGFNRFVFRVINLIPAYRHLQTPIPKIGKKELAEIEEQRLAREREAQEAERTRAAQEAARRADQAYRDEYEALAKQIRLRFTRDHLNVVIAVANQNGGAGKTTTACQIASVIADVARVPVAVIEGRKDSALGMEILGVDVTHTVTVRQLYDRRDEVTSAKALYGMTSSNRYGVVGVATDEEIPEDDEFDGDKGGEVVDLVSDHFPVVIVDTANTPTEDVNMGMVAKADVGIFPTVPARLSVKLCRLTKQSFERHSRLRHIAAHSIFVVTALEPGQTAEDFRSDLETSDRSPVYGIPYDPYIYPENVVNLEENAPETNLATLRSAAGILDVAYEVRRTTPST